MTKPKVLPGGSTLAKMLADDVNSMRITIKRRLTSDGIDALEILSFDELCGLAGVNVDEYSPAGDFINTLLESYTLMIHSIVERNPEKLGFSDPGKYPEFEIYDSVHAILEVDEVETIASNAGIEGNAQEFVKKISDDFFAEVNDIFCNSSGWDPMLFRKPPDVIYHGSINYLAKETPTMEEII